MTTAERQQLRSIGLSDKAIDTLESMGAQIVPPAAAMPAGRSKDPCPGQLTVDDVIDAIDQEN